MFYIIYFAGLFIFLLLIGAIYPKQEFNNGNSPKDWAILAAVFWPFVLIFIPTLWAFQFILSAPFKLIMKLGEYLGERYKDKINKLL